MQLSRRRMLVSRTSRIEFRSRHRLPPLTYGIPFDRLPAAHFTLAPHSNSNPTKSFKISTSASRAKQLNQHLSSPTFKQINMSQLPISERGHHGNAPGTYAVRKNGPPNTLEHRIYIEKDGVPVSPFHDVPLYANEQQTILNMIVEIPRWTNAKMEVPDVLNIALFYILLCSATDQPI